MMKPTRAWQRMLSGRRLDLLDPSWSDIEVEDIAHGLSRVARWNGQTRGDWAYSVAQHSVLVERIAARLHPRADAEERLATLLHDASEYVIGDLISPFKTVVGGDYKALENRLMNAILLRFGLPQTPKPAVARRIKKADRIAAHIEAVQLAGFSAGDADHFFGCLADAWGHELQLTPQTPRAAKTAFLDRFMALQTARKP